MAKVDESKRVSLWGEIENGLPNGSADTTTDAAAQPQSPEQSNVPLFEVAVSLDDLRKRSGGI